MDVPATRPEVTTTGIYGDELGQIRQHLLRGGLTWCGDLTAHTQVLIVGRITPVGSRKLSVARSKQLPCVSSTWVTEGACLLDATDAFDVCHELTGKEVCTTSLSHLERGHVQAVCTKRGATYNPLLTRHCGLLVAPTSALAFTSPSASSQAATNDKIRFVRKHGIWTISVDEFSLRYGVESLPQHGAPSSGDAHRVVRDNRQPLLRIGSTGLNEGGCHTRSGACADAKHDPNYGEIAWRGSSSNIGTRDVLVSRSVRCTASSTPRPSATAVNLREAHKGAAPLHTVDMEGSYHSNVGVDVSAIPSTLPSQLTAIAGTAASLTLTPSPRLLGDEFSDVVAYCSPPNCLTTEQRDLLCGMGMVITPLLTPSTTHVLVLGETLDECLYPRPSLHIVSWQWVSQSQQKQRRLSCAGFRVPVSFCPVLTFTGFSAGEKHELVTALRHSGLPCEVQEALVLGGTVQKAANLSNALTPSFLLRNTTHLVSLRRQLLESQKVAVLAQRCRLSSSSSCRLVGADWICRSIEHGQWLDPELFALALPHPEAFALAAAAAAHKTKEPEGTSLAGNRSSSRGAVHASAQARTMPPPQQRGRLPSHPSPLPSLKAETATSRASSQPQSFHCFGQSPLRAEVVTMKPEEEGAAHSQHNTTTTTTDAEVLPCGTLPPSSRLQLCAVQRDEDDEEAGGKSPPATTALQPALQAIYTSQTERYSSTPSSSDKDGGTGSCASPPKNHFTISPHRTAPTGTSHTYLYTQYSPTFENLLGELEAHLPGVLGRDLAFSSLVVPARPPSTNAVLPAEQISEALCSQGAELTLSSPPSSVDEHGQHQQHNLLHRASLYRQRLLQRRQQQPSFLTCRNLSDDSQVIFYQMGFGDHATVASFSPSGSQGNPQTKDTDAILGSATATHIAESAAAATTSSAANATRPHEGVHGATASYTTSAVFLITKDVLKGSDFDWDDFAEQFPHFRRTSKPEECTHFITAKPSKTEQFLCCLAAGHWILTPAYLSACTVAGCLVKEDTFEWSAEVAAMLGCRSSVASLVRGCKTQRLARERPFARWQVQVCCTSAARADSFLRVLRNGGCTSLHAVTAEEVLATAKTIESTAPAVPGATESKMVLADDTVFTEEELEVYAQYAAACHLCPILRLDYLVQHLCVPESAPSEMDLLNCVRSHKRSRVEPHPMH